MNHYVRPVIDAPVFEDAQGRVIDYGNRWGDESPPEDTYSVDTHPQRFAPIHTIGEALIAHLSETYDVSVTDDASVLADWYRPEDVIRAVRVVPNAPECAALTFVFTSYPTLVLHAGVLHDYKFPSCGCEACDEAWEPLADELEQQVAAVVSGRYREAVGPERHPWVEYEFTYPDGGTFGRDNSSGLPKERLRAARLTLQKLTGRWVAWPKRVENVITQDS